MAAGGEAGIGVAVAAGDVAEIVEDAGADSGAAGVVASREATRSKSAAAVALGRTRRSRSTTKETDVHSG